jgi:aspartokinase
MVAASMNADLCYIYTDVNGVYTADPRIEKNAIKINELSYDETIEIAKDGAKVLQTKSVIAAKKYNISLKVLSSFEENSGTMIANMVMIDRDKDLKVISCNDNLFYCEIDNCLVDDFDFQGKNDFGQNFVLIPKIKKHFYQTSMIVNDIVKIAVMSLNNSEVLDLSSVKQLLDINNVNFLYCSLDNRKVIIVLKSKFKVIVINLLHEFFNSS